MFSCGAFSFGAVNCGTVSCGAMSYVAVRCGVVSCGAGKLGCS